MQTLVEISVLVNSSMKYNRNAWRCIPFEIDDLTYYSYPFLLLSSAPRPMLSFFRSEDLDRVLSVKIARAAPDSRRGDEVPTQRGEEENIS